jgi:molybdopterin-containing oxidoreductase family iron-sulfur binding subunit
VRYFNWFGYGEPERKQYAWPEPMHWSLNPDVTVRGKGVMEKCSFCVQRIRESEGRAKAEGRPMQADEFTTACAQACPSRAIIFGDAADENRCFQARVRSPRVSVFEGRNVHRRGLSKVSIFAGVPGEAWYRACHHSAAGA